ncbi:MAG: imidazoleglycerol-phosphate dehydratase HisB [Oscillospiraceae bacterium]|jgi:imidazoleglycerol-phosphate dehydratase|nr:imidazoleglycerol-phosphate dehydratase HisB [Oscillospiraceae bacterium]
MKEVNVARKTKETDISLSLSLFGKGKGEINTGLGFFDHMLKLFAAHGRFDLKLSCKGDLEVDGHHTVEDVGIALGEAFARALGDKAGVTRYASVILPMDEALVMIALDLSGRAHLSLLTDIAQQSVGGFDVCLLKEFLLALTRSMGLTLHVRQLSGENAHHIIEAVFKGLGRAMSAAVSTDPRLAGEIPSTKGVL